jgi:hypothetical protein
MGKYNWWRRSRPAKKLQTKNALKGRSFILQQLEHGDYCESDFRRQAEGELVRCKKELKTFSDEYKGHNPKEDSRYNDIERKYRKRYNLLMQDYDTQEKRTLHELKQNLITEFEVDVWDEVVEEAVNTGIETDEKFYHLYSKMSQLVLSE